jgi:thioredoxin reductase (NADPH)
VALGQRDGNHLVRLEDGTAVTSRTVLIATGARYRKLGLARLGEFEGFSVYYAATEVEALTCANDPVVVVGGGNSAAQAALFLAQHAARVRLVVRDGDLKKDMSRYLADRIQRDQSIEVLLNTEVSELLGGQKLEGVVVKNNVHGETRELEARAMFVFIGAEPHVSWLEGQLELDDKGFLLTGSDVVRHTDPYIWQELGRQPLHLESSRPGIFVAGDVRSGSIKRVASAVGEGAMSVRLVYEHLGGVKRADP